MRKALILPLLGSLLGLSIVRASAPLSPLDQFVVGHGFGGAQFVRYENTYRVPINANCKVGDLTIDTGAANSVIFRAGLKKFNLTTESTDVAVRGVFGTGTEKVGLTTAGEEPADAAAAAATAYPERTALAALQQDDDDQSYRNE